MRNTSSKSPRLHRIRPKFPRVNHGARLSVFSTSIVLCRNGKKLSFGPGPRKRRRGFKKDRQGFKDLIESIDAFISNLYNILDVLATEDIRNELNLIRLEMVAVTNKIEELRLLQEAFSATAGVDSSISTVVSLRILHVNPDAAQVGTAVKLKPLKWKLLTGVLDPEESSTRTIAKYDNANVFIEWKPFSIPRSVKIDERVQNLAIFLQAPKERTFRSLNCKGVLEDSGHSRYCFLFQRPESSPSEVGVPPRTLLNLLSSSYIPSLTARFRLASQLAHTVLHLHSSGWLHKAIRSDNVLFFPSESHAPRCLDNPYLMGYEYARLDSVGELSEKPSNNPDNDIYRHPLAQGPTSSNFTMAFDIYSLGILLYEIAVWRSFKTVVKRLRVSRYSSSEMQKVRNRIVDAQSSEGLFKDLEFRVGIMYAGAVKVCIGEEFENTNLNPDEFIRLFFEKVVQTLQKCHA